jgi:hypothetical protein
LKRFKRLLEQKQQRLLIVEQQKIKNAHNLLLQRCETEEGQVKSEK